LKEGLCKNYDTWDLKDETNYKQGKLNGVKKVYYTNEAKSYAPNVTNIQEETFYINDLREGVTKWYSKNDKLAVEYNYHNGLLEGVQKTYFDDGKNVQIEELYKNNIPIEYKEYYRSGKIKTEGKYNSNGQKHGEWKNYSEDGKLLKPTRFIDGNEIKK
jgi:antitoxin component YwqK of YwqJK toxin-antitoxin module